MPSIEQNLQPLTGNGDVFRGVKDSLVGPKKNANQTNMHFGAVGSFFCKWKVYEVRSILVQRIHAHILHLQR